MWSHNCSLQLLKKIMTKKPFKRYNLNKEPDPTTLNGALKSILQRLLMSTIRQGRVYQAIVGEHSRSPATDGLFRPRQFWKAHLLRDSIRGCIDGVSHLLNKKTKPQPAWVRYFFRPPTNRIFITTESELWKEAQYIALGLKINNLIHEDHTPLHQLVFGTTTQSHFSQQELVALGEYTECLCAIPYSATQILTNLPECWQIRAVEIFGASFLYSPWWGYFLLILSICVFFLAAATAVRWSVSFLLRAAGGGLPGSVVDRRPEPLREV